MPGWRQPAQFHALDADEYLAAAQQHAAGKTRFDALMAQGFATRRDTERMQATAMRARAALDLARKDRQHIMIVAPIDGVVGNRQVQVGQKAEVRVDALGGDPFIGTVENLTPGSASEFTLLPFEPGSGNFTKIIQRIGVRIPLDPNQAALARLRPGLSVTAKVRLR